MSTRLVTISVVRNEADIIETFVRHHCALGARMHFILHRCIDNTEEILEKIQKEGLPITLEASDDAGYLQGERITEAARRIAAEKSADWILPLDADEFLVCTETHVAGLNLETLSPDRITLLSWRTYVPTPDDDITESCVVRRIFYRRTTEAPPIRKVLIPTAVLAGKSWTIPTGLHAVLDTDSGNAMPTIVSAHLCIAHFPVRSSEQLCAKVLGGWTSVVATPNREPERCYHWKSLLARCSEGRALTMSELRNIALRYAMPEGSDAIPTLTRDAISTPVARPLYAVHPISTVAVLLDAALSCAERDEHSEFKGDDLQRITEALEQYVIDLQSALIAHRDLPALHGLMQEDLENGAIACIIAMLSGVVEMGQSLTGSALSRRQQISRSIPALPSALRWIQTLLAADKLPHTLERSLQTIVAGGVKIDIPALRQMQRTQSASDDVVLSISQKMTHDDRAVIPPALAICIAQSLQHLLEKEAGIQTGLGDSRIRMIDPACARGEIACELLRRSTHASLANGAHPDTLRKKLLGQMLLRDQVPRLLDITSVRMAATFVHLRMPLASDENIAVSHSGIAEISGIADSNCIPVVGTAIVDGSTAFHEDEDTLSLLEKYLRKVRASGMDRDALHSPALQSIAHIHAVLRSAPVSCGGIVVPRSMLHGAQHAAMRELLLEDFEQIWIMDLAGASPTSAKDEPIDGSHESGTALLFLVRAPGAKQGTHYVLWEGLRIQKYHALLSRAFSDLPWKRIAPEKPGYVFLPPS
jgi:hypothetical protein